MKTSLTIKPVTPADAPALLSIYRYYVTETAISFECEPPTEEAFAARIEKTLAASYPYVKAVLEDGHIAGYAYAGPFVGREAYRYSAAMTVYLDPAYRRRGIGRRLYEEIEARLKERGVRNLYACIGHPDSEDEYLTCASERFHAKLGYKECGRFRKCGFKFGRWYDMIWMEKIIGPHDGERPADDSEGGSAAEGFCEARSETAQGEFPVVNKDVITITDGRRTVLAPFYEDDTVLTAMQRVVKFMSPCGGKGWCGQCLIDVEREDGTLKRELACFLKARPMTVHIRLVRPFEFE